MRLGTAALTLAFSLGVVGLAAAEESGNWFTRLFSPSAEKTESAKKLDVKAEAPKMPAASNNNRSIKAKADLERRQEVCMKLLDIANATGDDSLRHKAEMLDQRSYDLYVATKNASRSVEADAKKGGR
jgi:hypothetical protein